MEKSIEKLLSEYQHTQTLYILSNKTIIEQEFTLLHKFLNTNYKFVIYESKLPFDQF